MKVASEMLVLAKELLALEFDTKKEMDDYKREHDVRRDTKMTVKPEGKKEPAKEESPHSEKAMESLSKLSSALKHLPKADRAMKGVNYFVTEAIRGLKSGGSDALRSKGHLDAAFRALKDVVGAMSKDDFKNHKDDLNTLAGHLSALESKTASDEFAGWTSHTARDFPNQKALNKYLREHPKADRGSHRVLIERKPDGTNKYDTDSDEHAKFFEHKDKDKDNSREKLLKHLTKHPEITPKTHTIHEYAPNHGEYPAYGGSEYGGYTLLPRPKAKPNKNEKVVTKMWDDIGRGSEKHPKKVTGELLVLARELLGIGM